MDPESSAPETESLRTQSPGDPPRRFFYCKRHRVTSSQEFTAVFDHQIRKSRGPITVFIKPNGLGEHRLGLSIGRRAGNAVVRGRIKRMIREAFRHDQHSIPMGPGGTGFDLVVTARKHEPVPLEIWREWFVGAATAAVRVAQKHASKSQDGPDAG